MLKLQNKEHDIGFRMLKMANQDKMLSISEDLHNFDSSKTENNPNFEAAGQFLNSFKQYQQPFNQINLQVIESKDVNENNSLQINQQVDIQIGFLQDQYKKLKQKQQELQQRSFNEGMQNQQFAQQNALTLNIINKQLNNLRSLEKN